MAQAVSLQDRQASRTVSFYQDLSGASLRLLMPCSRRLGASHGAGGASAGGRLPTAAAEVWQATGLQAIAATARRPKAQLAATARRQAITRSGITTFISFSLIIS